MFAYQSSSPRRIGASSGQLSATVPSVATTCLHHPFPSWRCHADTTYTKDAIYNTCKLHTSVRSARRVLSTWSCSGGSLTKQLKVSRCLRSSPTPKPSFIATTAPRDLPSSTIGWETSVPRATPTTRTKSSCWADPTSSRTRETQRERVSVAVAVRSSRLHRGDQVPSTAAHAPTSWTLKNK